MFQSFPKMAVGEALKPHDGENNDPLNMVDEDELDGQYRDDFFRKISSHQKNDSFGDSFEQASPD